MKKQKLNQSGRSMVEMLGVLAVVGVLSVGGVVGYRSAMAQLKANQVWNDVLLWAAVIRGIPAYNSGASQVAGPVASAELEKVSTSGYQITGEIGDLTSNGAFQLVVKDVPYDVCEKILDMRPDDKIAVRPNFKMPLNGWINECQTGKNKIEFFFDFPALCASVCQTYYDSWKGYCGTSMKSCDKRYGFWCEQFNSSKTCENGGSPYACRISRYHPSSPSGHYGWSFLLWKGYCS